MICSQFEDSEGCLAIGKSLNKAASRVYSDQWTIFFSYLGLLMKPLNKKKMLLPSCFKRVLFEIDDNFSIRPSTCWSRSPTCFNVFKGSLFTMFLKEIMDGGFWDSKLISKRAMRFFRLTFKPCFNNARLKVVWQPLLCHFKAEFELWSYLKISSLL